MLEVLDSRSLVFCVLLQIQPEFNTSPGVVEMRSFSWLFIINVLFINIK